MMSYLERPSAADDAADAFYGQNEQAFMEQLQSICAADPRLIKAFQNTRETFQQQKSSRS